MRLDFDMGGTRAPKPKPGAPRDRPWRKSAEAVAAEREEARRLLGASGGVDLAALRYALRAQEAIDAAEAMHEVIDAQQATTHLLQAATNACSVKEVSLAFDEVVRTIDAAGLKSVVVTSGVAHHLSGLPKLQLLHQVMPRLWLGGWAALNNDCEALRSRHITHVASIVSADQRRLPAFITGHYYRRVDDRDAAADELARHFESAVAFIETARKEGGSVFVHCGAGISRAPSITTAYVMWKLGLGAADALRLVKGARACVRPNPGFVAQLKAWEVRLKTVGVISEAMC